MKRFALAAALVSCIAGPAGAHEIGKTQVTVTIRDAAYTADIVVDPDALLTKLEVFGGTELSKDLDRRARDRRIDQLSVTFLDRVAVRFDGRRDQPRFAYIPASAFGDAAQSPSLARLTGTVPPGAEHLTFEYGLALGSFALNVRIGDGPAQTFWLEGAETSVPISLTSPPPPPTTGEVARQYFGLGYTHILPKGLDHILFVLGIFLLSARWRSILLQVSTFTLAHSITLGLTMYGVVSLPAKVVEPMIALSIAYVAVENLMTSELKPWRLLLVFGFGLVHGMGFAEALSRLQLQRSDFLTTLVCFNVGVEAGQLTIIAAAWSLAALWALPAPRYRQFIVVPASIGIALIGAIWTIQRLF